MTLRKLLPAAAVALALSGVSEAETFVEGPETYLHRLRELEPGDTLSLTAGTYRGGLPVHGLDGTASEPIVITGPENGPPAVFLARPCRNTVSLRDASHVEIRRLEIDGRGLEGVDAVKAEGTARYAHHITLEDLYIHGHGSGQQTVGISTKCPAWGWVVRRNVIAPAEGEGSGAGTGMYFGDSDGSAPFVDGLIEGNIVIDTLGYNLQIKHQRGRPALEGMPSRARTIVRHNVFVKRSHASSGKAARPNVLVGHFPLEGDGSNDVYLVEANVFWRNASGESLFQGEGNVTLSGNLFFNPAGLAVAIQPHNDVPRRIRVVGNTVVAGSHGIRIVGVDEATVAVSGNVIERRGLLRRLLAP